MSRPLVVLGCGGHGKVVADAAASAGVEVLGFADDAEERRGRTIGGLPVVAIGRNELVSFTRSAGAEVVLAIGDNASRRAIHAELAAMGVGIGTVIHPSAVLARSVKVGRGTVVFAGAVINTDSSVGENVIVNTGVRIDHDNVVADHVHLSPGVVLGGTVAVGEGTHLAVGVSVRNNVTIGAWSLVGVGAAVVGNLPDGVLAYGVPARVVRVRE